MSTKTLSDAERKAKLDQAEQLLRLFELDRSNLRLANDAADAAMDCQDWDNARAILSIALEEHPESADLMGKYGYWLLCQGRLEDAKQQLSSAVDAGLESDAVRYNLAYCELLLQNYESALDIAENLVDPTLDRDATMLKARCHHHLGELDVGIALLESHQQKGEKDWELIGLMALMQLDDGRLEDALENATNVLASDAKCSDAALAFAGAKLANGDYAEAESAYDSAVEQFPTSGRAWSGKAQLEMRNFELERALPSINRAVELMPDHVGSWHAKAWLHLLQNDLEHSLNAFLEALNLDRNFGETHGGLASVYALQGNIPSSEKHLTIARRLSPAGLAKIYAEIVLLNRQGKSSDAKALMDTFLKNEHETLGVVPERLVQKRLLELANKGDSSLH